MKITETQFLNHIKERCEEDFEFFVRYFFKSQNNRKFVFSYHHHEICKALMQVHRGEITHLMINMPPRYSKTELVVKMFSAWCFAKNPSCEFLHLSYSDTLALDNSATVKNLILSKEFQQLWPIELKKSSDEGWKTVDGGAFSARSSGGQVTGFGAGKVDDFQNGHGFGGAIIIDDPTKPTDANSDVKREAVNKNWHETIKSRFNSPKTPCIVIMQRIHEEDFCGMLLKDTEHEWHHLVLPAILDEGTDNERALWPEKHSLERLKAMEKADSYQFQGQMMQRPYKVGGNIIRGEWFKRYSRLPKLKYKAVFMDTAQKEKESNDFQVAECWGLGEDGNIYLIDLFHERFQAWELLDRARAFWSKHRAKGDAPLRCLYVEDKASGTQLIQDLKNRTVPRIPVQAIERSRSKYERVMDVQSYIQSGYVYIPEDAPFIHDFVKECEAFTANDTHPHDDQIDAMCDAIQTMLASTQPAYWEIL